MSQYKQFYRILIKPAATAPTPTSAKGLCSFKWLCLLLFAFLLILNILYLFLDSFWAFTRTNIFIENTSAGDNYSVCELPDPNPFGADMKPFLKYWKDYDCTNYKKNIIKQIVFIQERGKRQLRKIRQIQAKCCFKAMFPVGGLAETNHCIEIPENATLVQIPKTREFEFVHLICRGKQNYVDGFAFADEFVDTAASLNNSQAIPPLAAGQDRLNVIILGLDNTSRMHFLRALNKSHHYLVNNLSAVVMKGYTKVADNSLPNLLPVLTGKSYGEFVKTCAPSSKSQLDGCPIIWKEFSKAGFRTGFSEDEMGIAIFNLNWAKPWLKKPTDFYIHPFSSYMQENMAHGHGGMCYGTRQSFKLLLDYIENTAVAMGTRPFFHFTWTTKLSHDYFPKLRLADAPLLQFLQSMKNDGQLNHTALIIMGDHGARSPFEVQLTPLGKIEVRMPALYVVLPPWFKLKYSKAYKNLEQNADKITSPFDLNKTLKIFMNLTQLETIEPAANLKGMEQRNPLSLFQNIPATRTCFEAGVSLHWCACKGARDERIADVTSPDVKQAAQSTIDYMMNSLKPVKSKCMPLRISKIVSAFHIDYGTKSTNSKFSSTKAMRIYIKTYPGDAYFSATVVLNNGNWALADVPIRVNHYGSQSGCVTQEHKFYCYCYDYHREHAFA